MTKANNTPNWPFYTIWLSTISLTYGSVLSKMDKGRVVQTITAALSLMSNIESNRESEPVPEPSRPKSGEGPVDATGLPLVDAGSEESAGHSVPGPADSSLLDANASALAGIPLSSGLPLEEQTVISKRTHRANPAYSSSITSAKLGRSLVGQRLDHYQLDEFVGGGGMGAVFRATDLMLDRIVAVKILSRDKSADDDTVRRFKNEAQSAARLDHANIARVYYVGEASGWHYIVFEYIEGTNIRDLVAQQGPLPLDQAISYVLQVAEALSHASQRGIVHRDIKPSNILVTQRGRAKLVDMGLARFHQVDSGQEDLTATGVTLGTFDYISPEQARDPRSADVRSDLYSLGCTFYFMLTGRPPFPDGTVLQKLLSHSGDTPPDPRQFCPHLPEEIAAIISKMLSKHPEDRYQDPSEIIGELLVLANRLRLSVVESGVAAWVTPSKTRITGLQRHLPWLIPLLILIGVTVILRLVWRANNPANEQTPPSFVMANPPDPQNALPPSAVGIQDNHRKNRENNLATHHPPPNQKKPAAQETRTGTGDNAGTKTGTKNQKPDEKNGDKTNVRVGVNGREKEGAKAAGGTQESSRRKQNPGSNPKPQSTPDLVAKTPGHRTQPPATSPLDVPKTGTQTEAVPKTPSSIQDSILKEWRDLAPLRGFGATEVPGEKSSDRVSLLTPPSTGQGKRGKPKTPSSTAPSSQKQPKEAIAGDTPGRKTPSETVKPSQPPAALSDVLIVGEGGEETLAIACAKAQKNPNLKIIELHYDGPRLSEPLTLANCDLTIRAGYGFSPILAFRPAKATPFQSMFAISGGKLVFENVQFEFDTPSNLAPNDHAKKWELFKLDSVEMLQMTHCVMTIRNASKDQEPRCPNVAFFDVDAKQRIIHDAVLDAYQSVGTTSGGPLAIDLRHCIVRGEATLLRVDQMFPFRFSWNNGLLATTERLLQAGGATIAQAAGNHIKIELNHVTAVMKRGMCLLINKADTPHQLVVAITCNDSILMTAPTSPLIKQGYIDTRKTYQSRLRYRGQGNFYPQVRLFWEIASRKSPEEKRPFSFADWERFWDREELPQQAVKWQKLPDASLPTHAVSPADYKLISNTTNPAYHSASDQSDAGFAAKQLPKLSPVQEAIRAAHPDFPTP